MFNARTFYKTLKLIPPVYGTGAAVLIGYNVVVEKHDWKNRIKG